jgi:hypothetical protein
MLTIRAMAAVAAVFAAALLAAAPALASCDSIYTPACKPIPAKDPPEPAGESEKASKPLQISGRRQASRKAKAERTARTQRKRFGKKSGTQRVLTLRQRRANAIAARARERIKPAAIEAEDDEASPLPPSRSAKAPRRGPALVDASASSGEATDLTAASDVLRPQPVVTIPVAAPVAAPAEQARPAPAAGPAPLPVHTASQSEVNEIDLAAAATPDPADQSWMRTLVLAFGGLLAVGSALRLFL